MERLKHIVFDSVGVVLILLSPTLGWLPGPGGIPLLLAGLGLLSINHHWAKKSAIYIKNNGLKMMDHVFREHEGLQALYDVLSFVFFAIGIYLINTYTRSATLTVSVLLFFTAITLFLGNRKRLDKFTKWLKRKLNR